MSRRSALAASLAALAVVIAAGGAQAGVSQAAQTGEAQAIDARAVAALDRMSAYLAGLSAFEVTSTATQDLVLDDGHTVKLGFRIRYLARPPQGLYAEVHSDRQHRNFYFDGSTLTMTAPRMGFYASASAQGSLRDLMDVLANDYGVDMPLADLFLWNARATDGQLTFAAVVGYAEVAGQETDQYLFVAPAAEWQVWIKRGETPLPLRLVVTDTADPARPQFAADLSWNTTPTLAADAFTFRPPQAARRIVFGELTTQESDQ